MISIQLKVMIFPEGCPQGISMGCLRIGHLTALAADQMNMRAVFLGGIDDLSLPKIGAADQALLNQQVKCTVDSRQIDGFRLPVNFFEDHLRGEVGGSRADGIDDQLPLWGDPVASFPQGVEKGFSQGHSGICFHPLSNANICS